MPLRLRVGQGFAKSHVTRDGTDILWRAGVGTVQAAGKFHSSRILSIDSTVM
jgi:hypothetical protein